MKAWKRTSQTAKVKEAKKGLEISPQPNE